MNKLIFISTILFFISFDDTIAADNCRNLGTEEERTACSIKELKKIDGQLNATYVQVYKKSDDQRRADLRYLQRRWIVQRDDKCELHEINKTKADWMDSLSTDRKKIWCVERETKKRIEELLTLSNEYLKTHPDEDICTFIKKSIERYYDQMWLKILDPSRRFRRLKYLPPGEDRFGRLYIRNDLFLKVDPPNYGHWSRYKAKVDATFVDIDGDNADEILLDHYLSRPEGAEYMVLKKIDSIYTALPGGHVQLSPVYYRSKTYLVRGLKIFQALNNEIKLICEFNVTYDGPNIKSNCNDSKICKIVMNDPRLFRDDINEVWDQISRKDEWEGKYKIPPELEEDMSADLVDIDNDRIPEIGLIFRGNPFLPPTLPFFYKLEGDKYLKVDVRKKWRNFNITNYGSSWDRELFIKNDGSENYVVVREKISYPNSHFGKGYNFSIVLVRGEQVETVGEITAKYSIRVEIRK